MASAQQERLERLGSGPDRWSAIDTAAQHVQALDASGLFAQVQGKKCRTRGHVRRQMHRVGTSRPVGELLRLHASILTREHAKAIRQQPMDAPAGVLTTAGRSSVTVWAFESASNHLLQSVVADHDGHPADRTESPPSGRSSAVQRETQPQFDGRGRGLGIRQWNGGCRRGRCHLTSVAGRTFVSGQITRCSEARRTWVVLDVEGSHGGLQSRHRSVDPCSWEDVGDPRGGRAGWEAELAVPADQLRRRVAITIRPRPVQPCAAAHMGSAHPMCRRSAWGGAVRAREPRPTVQWRARGAVCQSRHPHSCVQAKSTAPVGSTKTDPKRPSPASSASLARSRHRWKSTARYQLPSAPEVLVATILMDRFAG